MLVPALSVDPALVDPAELPVDTSVPPPVVPTLSAPSPAHAPNAATATTQPGNLSNRIHRS